MVVASAVLVWTTGLLTFKAMLTCPSKETFLQAAGAGYGDLSRASRVSSWELLLDPLGAEFLESRWEQGVGEERARAGVVGGRAVTSPRYLAMPVPNQARSFKYIKTIIKSFTAQCLLLGPEDSLDTTDCFLFFF